MRTALPYATRLLSLFPIIVLSSFYSTWVAARLALGHWPRASIDDPKDIAGPFFSLHYYSAELLNWPGVPAFGVAVIVMAFICLVKRPEGWKMRLLELGATGIVFFFAIALARWDPLRVVEWFFD